MGLSKRDIRRLAFQALYQLDVRGDTAETDDLRCSLWSSAQELKDGAREADADRALEIAQNAWDARRVADEEFASAAPAWRTVRQPAVDRAILRLAHYEMTSGRVPPKAAVNEAIELAKRYSTERSPAFINGVLDRVLKRVLANDESSADNTGAATTGEV